MTAGWCSRTVRAVVFAAVCVLLAALGHVMMSGSHVSAWPLAAGAVATGVAGWSLAGRERGLPLIVTVVVAAQTALHEAFSFTQSATEPSGATTSMDMSGMGSMDMGSTHMDSMDMAHAHAMNHSVAAGSPTAGMLAAHLLAALLCGLWLAYGEKAAFRILRAVAGWLAAPLRLLLALPAVPDRSRIRRGRPRSDRAPSLRLLVHSITSRGPPAHLAVI
ncbi:hypothetical protein [Streptomyces ipomoeae]|uniref:hypothetical protein n=1 Tax=Streptomyces ipomoeae TaxID=103232 RepID=UPI0011476270|nr:hypothetical protein [Streptomyces ipomoeae]MDX2938691.1 hypothetical protein [Streptomyces ipomoeae]TQE19482.1 hypothetical protein SipoB123_31300 [Streptomyces ipomoeae]